MKGSWILAWSRLWHDTAQESLQIIRWKSLSLSSRLFVWLFCHSPGDYCVLVYCEISVELQFIQTRTEILSKYAVSVRCVCNTRYTNIQPVGGILSGSFDKSVV